MQLLSKCISSNVNKVLFTGDPSLPLLSLVVFNILPALLLDQVLYPFQISGNSYPSANSMDWLSLHLRRSFVHSFYKNGLDSSMDSFWALSSSGFYTQTGPTGLPCLFFFASLQESETELYL